MKIPKGLAIWFDRMVGWAETAAEIWASYWLLIIGSFLVFGSAILKWVQFPFSQNVRGLGLSFLHDPGITPHFTPFSVGAIGVVLLAIGLLLWRRSPTMLGLVAAVVFGQRPRGGRLDVRFPDVRLPVVCHASGPRQMPLLQPATGAPPRVNILYKYM